MLTLKDIRYYWGPQPVLDSVSLFVGRGEKAGLVGANGAGKTTLLRIAAGEITPDGGRVGRPNRTGYLPQEPDVSAKPFRRRASVRDVVVSASPTAALAQQLAAAERRLGTTAGPELEAAVEEYSRLEGSVSRSRRVSSRGRGGDCPARLGPRAYRAGPSDRAIVLRGAHSPSKWRGYWRAALVCSCWTSQPTTSTWRERAG